MDQTSYNPKAALKVIKTIYAGLLAGPIIFFVLCLYLLDWKIPNSFTLMDPFNVSYIVLLVMVPIIYKFAEKATIELKPDSTLREKMAAYQAGLIMKVAVWEGIALFSCVILLQFDNTFSTFFFAISILAILSNYPKPEKFGSNIGLTQNEIDQFNY